MDDKTFQRLKAEGLAWMAARKQKDGETRAMLSGDESYIRWLLELREETGLDFDRIENGFTKQALEEITRKAAEKRSSKWPLVSQDDCFKDRSTMKRHAEDEARPYIKKVDRGQYRIHPEYLIQYVRGGEIQKYLLQ